ncbi:hypothetical protein GGR57DRAFT_507997 [Xylariaceae sp. FL1272]|nr:hypothetical protein GGR57DRAFT_507997 [Xylariaceae sp. FL1272]
MEDDFVLIDPGEAHHEDGQHGHVTGAAFDLQQLTPGDLGHMCLKLAKKGKYIQVYAMVMEINTGVALHPSKTLGIITSRHNPTILMSAQSGWSTGPQRDALCLDTHEFNGLALNHLAAQLDFHFPGNQRDNGSQRPLDEHRGRAHAGHVEVLLATWYAIHVARHSLGLVDETNVGVIKRLKELKDQRLGNRRFAFINIDSEPCLTCLKFLNKLEQHTRLMFHVSGPNSVGPIIVRVDGGRRDDRVEEVFPDSDDENDILRAVMKTPPVQPTPEDVIEPPRQDPEPISSATSHARFLPRRPPSSWPMPRPAEWKAPNDELVTGYKKGTPAHNWPGYPPVTPPAAPVLSPQPQDSGAEQEKEEPAYITISDTEEEYDMFEEEDTPQTEEDIDASKSHFWVAPEELGQANNKHTAATSVEIEPAFDWGNQAFGKRRQATTEGEASQMPEARLLPIRPTASMISSTEQAPLPSMEISPVPQNMSEQFARSALDVVRGRPSHQSPNNVRPVTSPSADAYSRLYQRRRERRMRTPSNHRRSRRSIFGPVPQNTHDLERFRNPIPEDRGEGSILARRFSILEQPEYTGSEL